MRVRVRVCVCGLMAGPWAGLSVLLSTGAVGTLIGHIMQKRGVDYVSGRNNGQDSAPVSEGPALKKVSRLSRVFVVD